MSYQASKPENALRRAQELQSISQSESALTILHETLSSRRHRTWSPTYEKIMISYIDLCLSLNRSRDAKDGLHQYRNLSQSQAPGSLEIVIKYLIDQSEQKCREAKEQSINNSDSTIGDEKHCAVVAVGEDLDSAVVLSDGDVSSMLLLSTMTADPAQNQRDSAVLLPRVKFLWEAYRAVLDILKSNSKLERLYHLTAIRALDFCAKYKRRTEFKRLCDLLKQHLDNLKKFGGAAAMARVEEGAAKQNNKIRGWEGWTTESIELHLQTRFSQLETASILHQYNEGFKVVEEIYNILQISHSRRKISSGQAPGIAPPPKAKLMAKYYEKLTTLFWVSENYLFHAFAWYKYYTLCREFNRGMTAEQKTHQASAVLLSALCIPNLPDSSLVGAATAALGGAKASDKITTTARDEYARKNSARMSTLLGFHTRNPTREALLSEIRAKNVMADVPPHLKDLYKLLEETSNPLVIVQNAKPLLEKLRNRVGLTVEDKDKDKDDDKVNDSESKLSDYVQPLISVLLLKLLHALSASYHTISLHHIQSLTSGLGVTFTQVEKAIVSAATAKHTSPLQVRIDHRAQCLRFGDSTVRHRATAPGSGKGYPLESGSMRSHLTILSCRLQSMCYTINPPDEKTLQLSRMALYNSVRSTVDREHDSMLMRKDLIEKRKEEAERVAQERLKEEEMKRLEAQQNAIEEEEKRLTREKQIREKEKMDRIKKELEMTEKREYLKAMGQNVDAMSEDELVAIDVDELAKQHATKAAKEKDDAERKVKEMEKKLDYIVRAVRIEEVPMVKKRYQERVKMEEESYQADVVEKARKAKIQWEKDCRQKAELKAHSVFDFMREFENSAMVGRSAIHKAKMLEEDKRAAIQAEKAKLQRARKRKEDEIRRTKEEEDRLKRAEEEKEAEEERQRREEERRKQEEARRKKENERLTAERERELKRESVASAPPSKDLESANQKYVPPSKSSGGGEGNSRWGNESRPAWGDSRGGSYGGGRYEGNRGDRVDGGAVNRFSDLRGDRGSERHRGGEPRGGRYEGNRFSGGGDRGDRYSSGGDRGDRDRGDRGDTDRYGSGGDRGDRYGSGGRWGNRDGRAPEQRNNRWN